MALAFADSVTKTFSTADGSAAPATLLNVATNDIIVVCVLCEKNSAFQQVSTVGATGLTFAKRSQKQLSTADGTPQDINLEVWWALAGSNLGSVAITVTLNAATDDAAWAAFRVTGANTAAPWDPNGSLPATAQNTATTGANTSVTGVSTTRANTALIGFFGTSAFSIPFEWNGWTAIARFANGGGTNAAEMTVQGKVVSAAQAAVEVDFATASQGTTIASFTRWGIIVDALTSDAAATPKSQVAQVGM